MEFVRPIAGVAPTDLWRPAMAKIQLDTLPLYHHNSGQLGTKLSFHSTTKRAWYTEKGPAHWLALALLGWQATSQAT